MSRRKGPPHHSTHIRIPVNVWNYFVKLSTQDGATIKDLIVTSMVEYARKREDEKKAKEKTDAETA